MHRMCLKKSYIIGYVKEACQCLVMVLHLHIFALFKPVVELTYVYSAESIRVKFLKYLSHDDLELVPVCLV